MAHPACPACGEKDANGALREIPRIHLHEALL